MAETETRHLRVLIANEKRERLELLAQVVAGLGHEVIAREIHVKEVGAVTARERPDVALVGLGLHSEHALELISEIVREASCSRDRVRASRLQPLRVPEQALYERSLATARQHLGEQQFDEAMEEGSHLTLDEAVALARSID